MMSGRRRLGRLVAAATAMSALASACHRPAANGSRAVPRRADLDRAAAAAFPAAQAAPPAGAPGAARASGPAETAGGTAPAEEPLLRGLVDAFPSLEALAVTVLEALAARDTGGLDAFRVTRREYEDLLFPRFASRGYAKHGTADFHWELLDSKTRVAIARSVRDYGGVSFRYLHAEPTQGVEDFGNLRLLKKVAIRVLAPHGHEVTLECCGSVVIYGGEYKLLSYRD